MKERYGEIAKNILIGVGIAGVVIVVAAAPGVVLVAKMFDQNGKQFPKKHEKHKTARTLRRLEKTKLIKITEKNGEFSIELTKKGKKTFKKMSLENIQITKPPHWDGKWRLVIFDIPDKTSRSAREILRARLKEWEFYLLQKSVWVCPWPCEKEIQMVAELYGIAPYVDVVVAEKIANDKDIRKHFGL